MIAFRFVYFNYRIWEEKLFHTTEENTKTETDIEKDYERIILFLYSGKITFVDVDAIQTCNVHLQLTDAHSAQMDFAIPVA